MAENVTFSDTDPAPTTDPNPNTENVSTGRDATPTETSKPDAPKVQPQEDTRPQSYVWLANGAVKRSYNEDLPGHAGFGAEYGYWTEDGKVFPIVAVYPVETVVKD